jgi:hypothetical protein
MKSTKESNYSASSEKKSMKLLSEKMGLSEKELEYISHQYGVSISQLVEILYNKYPSVYKKS